MPGATRRGSARSCALRSTNGTVIWPLRVGWLILPKPIRTAIGEVPHEWKALSGGVCGGSSSRTGGRFCPTKTGSGQGERGKEQNETAEEASSAGGSDSAGNSRARRNGSDRAGRCPASDLHVVGGQDGKPAQQPGRADHDAEPLARSDDHDRLQDRRHAGLRGRVRSVRRGRQLRDRRRTATRARSRLICSSTARTCTSRQRSRTAATSRPSSCDSFDVVNTVDVVDGDPLHPFATDTNTIHVVVHCDGGCTLTQGYWKTHSTYGPASKPDATWNLLPGGAGPNTVFFLSGASWYQVFWTAPAGNAYYNLADQYMAARLNILDGASAPASVSSAITTATGLFARLHAGADRGALRLECAAEAVRRPGGHPRLLQRGADRSGPLRRVASPVPPRNTSETPGRGGLAVSGTQDSNRPLRTRPEHAREPVRRRSSGTRARTRLAGARARGSRFGPACTPCLDRSSPAPLTERAHVGPAATSTPGRRDRADPRLRSDNDMAPRWRTGTYATGATGSQPGTARGAPAIHLGTCAGCSLVPARPL